jgi:hypothetical protein
MWFKRPKKPVDDPVTRTMSLARALQTQPASPVDSGLIDRIRDALSPQKKPESLRDELQRRTESFRQHQLRLQQQREEHFRRTTAEIRAALRSPEDFPRPPS